MAQPGPPLTGPGALSVRATRTPAENALLHRTTARVFSDPPDEAALVAATEQWRARAEDWRAFYPVHLRAAFQGDTYVGSDVIYERQLRLGTHGEAAVRTACIGVVLAHPEHRLKGIGRALMWDAVQLARQRECALLLLGGIADFYHRFGYVDVMERAGHAIPCAQIEALAGEPGIAVRPATEADAPALLVLYERHAGAHPGGFVRSLAEQRRLLQPGEAGQYYVLALDGGGPCGFVRFRGAESARVEAAVDTWPAAIALLRYQARLLRDVPEAPATVSWQVPPGSFSYFVLAEHLPLVSETRSRPRSGWMARPAHLPALFRSLEPALAARWRRAALAWSGTLTLDIAADPATDQEGGVCTLELGPRHLAVTRAGDDAATRREAPHHAAVRLLPGAFTQLVFGFRPVWWIAGQPGNDVPETAQPLLATLFPHEPAWVTASDGF